MTNKGTGVVGTKPTTSIKEEGQKVVAGETTTQETNVEVMDMPEPKIEIEESELKGKIESALSNLGAIEDNTVLTKTVIVKAVPTFIVTPPKVQSEAYVIIGCPGNGRAPYIPLEGSELMQVAGKVFGHTTQSTDFDAKLMDYFNNWRLRIEYGPEKTDGKKLTIPIDEKGNPIFHKDYVDDIIAYRICLKSTRVAKTSAEILEATSGESRFTALIYDASQEKTVERQLAKVMKQAEKDLLIISEKPKEMTWLTRLVMKGVPLKGGGMYTPADTDLRVDQMTLDDKEVVLRKFRDAHPGLFSEMVNDPNLEMKALIEYAVDLGYVTKSAGKISYGDEILGIDLEDAIKTLKSPRSNQILLNLKAAVAVAS